MNGTPAPEDGNAVQHFVYVLADHATVNPTDLYPFLVSRCGIIGFDAIYFNKAFLFDSLPLVKI